MTALNVVIGLFTTAPRDRNSVLWLPLLHDAGGLRTYRRVLPSRPSSTVRRQPSGHM